MKFMPNVSKVLSIFFFITLCALFALCIYCSNGTDNDDNGDNGPDTTNGDTTAFDTLTHPPDSFEAGELNYLGEFLDVNSAGRNMVIMDNYLYITQIGGFLIADVSDPSSPVTVGMFNQSDIRYGMCIEVKGDYAYLLAWDRASNSLFFIVDVADKSNPQTIAYIELTGQGSGVGIKSDYAFVAGAENGVYIIDISDPSNPYQIDVISVSKAYRLFTYNNYLFISSDTENHGGWQFDISNPTSPQQIFHFNTPGYTRSIFAKYNHVFVADGVYRYTSTGSFQIFSIDDLTNPVAADTLTNSVHSVYVNENFAYVVDWVSYSAHLTIYDIYNPSQPTQVLTPYELEVAKDVIVDGEYVFVLGRSNIHVFHHNYTN